MIATSEIKWCELAFKFNHRLMHSRLFNSGLLKLKLLRMEAISMLVSRSSIIHLFLVIFVGAISTLSVNFISAGLSPRGELPYNCDPFGYSRQAELFRQHGTLAGLDTKIESEVADKIIA